MANIDDIDRRTRVGTEAWKNKHDGETQQLSAWRRLHMLLTHEEIKKIAKPTDAPNKLAKLVKQFEKRAK